MTVPRAVRTALEFPSWYRYKTGQAQFADFVQDVLGRLVTNGAPVELLEIKVRSQPDEVVTNLGDPEDLRWAFGRLLSGDGKARVNSALVVSFPADNWIKIDNGLGDLRRSGIIRKAVVDSRPGERAKFILYQDATDELIKVGEGSWYQPGREQAFVGLEIVDLWALLDTFRQRQIIHRESLHVTQPRPTQGPAVRPHHGRHPGGSWRLD